MHWLSLFVLMAAACVLGLAWNGLPERWATHWSVGGQVDAWANKSVGAVFWPLLLGAVIWVTLEVVVRLAARRVQDDGARRRMFRVVRTAILMPAVILAATSVWLPLGKPSSPLPLIIFSMIVVLPGVLLVYKVAQPSGLAAEAGAERTRRGLFYKNPADERLWVETPLGFALNFGHPEARPLAGAMLLPPILILLTIAFSMWAAR